MLEVRRTAQRKPSQISAVSPANSSIESKQGKSTKQDETPQNGNTRELEAMQGYKKFYGIAYDFHSRHVIRGDAGKIEYWDSITEDLGRTLSAGGNNPFLRNLLGAVFWELEERQGLHGPRSR